MDGGRLATSGASRTLKVELCLCFAFFSHSWKSKYPELVFAVVPAENASGVYPADLDKASRWQRSSYLSDDGVTFTLLDYFGPDVTGNLVIRATVTTPR